MRCLCKLEHGNAVRLGGRPYHQRWKTFLVGTASIPAAAALTTSRQLPLLVVTTRSVARGVKRDR